MKRNRLISNILYLILSITIINDCVAESVWQKSYVLEAKGEYDKAAAVIESLIDSASSGLEGSPVDAPADREFALLRLGWLLYLGGNHSESIKAYQNSLKLNARSIDAQLGSLLPLIALGHWEKVKAIGDQILRDNPRNYLAHVRVMIAEEGMKQWDALSVHSSVVSTYYPSDIFALVYYARAEARLNHTKKARQIYYQVLQRSPFHIEANQFVTKMQTLK